MSNPIAHDTDHGPGRRLSPAFVGSRRRRAAAGDLAGPLHARWPSNSLPVDVADTAAVDQR